MIGGDGCSRVSPNRWSRENSGQGEFNNRGNILALRKKHGAVLDAEAVLNCNEIMRFMTLFSSAAVLMMAAAALHAADIPLSDNTIVLGERVGPIKMGMTSASLKALLGKQVKITKLDGPEGTVIEGAKAFPGTDRELEIMFNPEGAKKEIWDIVVVGKAWKFANGLKLGLTMTEIEKINGKPFSISGFGWDYGGYANFEGGTLEGKVSVRFDPGENVQVPDALSGDQQIPTTDKKLRALNPKAERISVFFR